MQFIYLVAVKNNDEILSSDQLDQLAMEEFQCLGKVDFDIDEARVDEILGKDAYCGGDIPEHLVEKLQGELLRNAEYTYFWDEEVVAREFLEKVVSLGLKAQLIPKEKKDWNESWRESFEEIKVSENLSVVPSWEKNEDSTKKVFIYPGMGFGTGNHETTFLCLTLFEEIIKELKEGSTCLDFGCGSGILGIVAVKKKRMVVDFVDIDTNALDNCVANLEYNEFQKYQEGHGVILRDRFKPEQKYGLVFANILESILISEYTTITDSLAKDGFLIVSGLLIDQEEAILSKYSNLQHLKTVSKGDWISILFKKG